MNRYTVTTAVVHTKNEGVMRRLLLLLAILLFAACGREEPLKITGEGGVFPGHTAGTTAGIRGGFKMSFQYFGPETLTERILRSDAIVRATLLTYELAALQRAHLVKVGDPGKYWPALKFTFEVHEYLKGSGAMTVTAYAYAVDYSHELIGDTEEEAKANAPWLPAYRDSRWDDREAILFLFPDKDLDGEQDTYTLGEIGPVESLRSGEIVRKFTVADDVRRAWLPDSSTPSAGGQGRSEATGQASSEQYFLLKDVAATTTATTTARMGRGPASSSASPAAWGGPATISKTSLRAEIARIEGQATTEALRGCILSRERRTRQIRTGKGTDWFHIDLPYNLASGLPADAEVGLAPFYELFVGRIPAAEFGKAWF